MKFISLLIFLFSTSLHAQWAQMNFPNLDVNCFASKDGLIFAGTDSGVYLSSDKGIHWEEAADIGKISTLAVSGENILAGTSRGTFISSNNGANWSSNLTNENVTSLIVSGNDLYAGTYQHGVFYSIDGGKSWVTTSIIDSLNTLAVFNSILFAGTDHGMFESFSDGLAWDLVSLRQFAIKSFLISDSNFYAITSFGLLLLNDTSYKQKKWLLTRHTNEISCAAVSGNTIVAGTDSGGCFFSFDTGSNWLDISLGLPANAIGAISFFDSFLFVGTIGAGIWRRSLSEFFPVSVTESPLLQFHLSQNFPNPFTESTSISFDIPERTFVSLKIFDVTGHKISVLANEMLDAGTYTREFHAHNFPAGMYLCRFEAGAYRESRTLVSQ